MVKKILNNRKLNTIKKQKKSILIIDFLAQYLVDEIINKKS